MTLTNRLNCFFLSALALVLAGFSGAIFILARQHLHRQVEEQLDSALAVLTAGIEQTPAGLEWEPSDRQLNFRSGDNLTWLVTDTAGNVVDRAGLAETEEFVRQAAVGLNAAESAGRRMEGPGGRWEVRQIRIEPLANPQPSTAAPSVQTYPALAITVAISLEPAQTTLQGLGASLIGLSAAILLACLFGGRWVCRRALRPLIDMAAAARTMEVNALDQRLPVAPNGDELEELARAFNGLLTRVQLAFDRQQRFTGEASHQLRTPLTALIGTVEVALRRERPIEEYRRVLTALHQQADRLNRIVEALLFLARADTEAQLPQREEIELARWLPEYLNTWPEHQRRADLALQTASASVNVHPVLFAELLNVLLDNAFKYSPPGTPVLIRTTRSGDTLLLSVEDKGTGIAEEDQPHLFEPFFRSSVARQRGIEGFGLGLSVAKRIATAFGGELSVESKLGEGSRFALRLPLPTCWKHPNED